MRLLRLFWILISPLSGLSFAADLVVTKSAPEVPLMRSAPDYDRMAWEQKISLRQEAISQIQSLQKESFADCDGRTTSFELSSDDPEQRPKLMIKSEDRTSASPDTDEHYLSIVAVDESEIIFYVPFDPNELRVVHDGLAKLFGENVALTDYRTYFVVRKTAGARGLFVTTSQWIYNRKTGAAVRTDFEDKHEYESSAIHVCRALNKKYLKDLEDKPLADADDVKAQDYFESRLIGATATNASDHQNDLLRAIAILHGQMERVAEPPIPKRSVALAELQGRIASQGDKLEKYKTEHEPEDAEARLHSMALTLETWRPEQKNNQASRQAQLEAIDETERRRNATQSQLDSEKAANTGEMEKLRRQITNLQGRIQHASERHWDNWFWGDDKKARDLGEIKAAAESTLKNFEEKQSHLEQEVMIENAAQNSQRARLSQLDNEIGIKDQGIRQLELDRRQLAINFDNYKRAVGEIEQKIRDDQQGLEKLKSSIAADRSDRLKDYPQELIDMKPGVPVLVKTDAGSTLKISFLDPQSLDEISAVRLASRDPSSRRYVVNSSAEKEAPPGVSDLTNLKFIRMQTANKITTFISIRGYLKAITPLLTTFRRDTPSHIELTSLPDYPLMVTALKRLGYVKEESDDLHALIFRQPKWEESPDKVRFSYINDFANEPSANDEQKLGMQTWKEFYSNRAIFTNLFGPALNEYGDLFFHGLVSLLDRNKSLPDAVQTKIDDEALTKKLEAEYEQSGREKMINVVKASPRYQRIFLEFKMSGETALRVNDHRQAMILAHPEMSSADIEKQIDQHLQAKADHEMFGEHFEKIDSTWKEVYVYTQSPGQYVAWKALISFLKHEKQMSFEQVLDHLESAAGYMPGSILIHPWATEFYRKLYTES